MKKLLGLFTVFMCTLFIMSCGENATPADDAIKPGTKLKITYVVDSAYFKMPDDAPKYHIYGKTTEIPVPEEKNYLGPLMKTKYWTDGTKKYLTTLGPTDYTADIVLTYMYSFDEEKCAPGYEMVDGNCEVIRSPEEKCSDNETYNESTDSCSCEEPYIMIGSNCVALAECSVNEIYDVASNSCYCDTGFINVGGACEVIAVCQENEIYDKSTNSCILE